MPLLDLSKIKFNNFVGFFKRFIRLLFLLCIFYRLIDDNKHYLLLNLILYSNIAVPIRMPKDAG